jgi:hypothetical protein
MVFLALCEDSDLVLALLFPVGAARHAVVLLVQARYEVELGVLCVTPIVLVALGREVPVFVSIRALFADWEGFAVCLACSGVKSLQIVKEHGIGFGLYALLRVMAGLAFAVLLNEQLAYN